ncbi:MAG: VWA domain-containing protein [Pseudomonadota bacterium]
MLELAQPWALLALPLPLLIWRLAPPRRKTASALRVPFFQTLVEAAGADPRQGSAVLQRGFLQTLVLAAIWACLVVGLAEPRWVGEPIVRSEAARDIMLAVDLSGSMDTRDFPDEDGAKTARFEAVQRVVSRFVAERESDRIGLIVFGDRAYLQLPFTRDLATADALVKLMQVGMAGPRTALGDAIGLSLHAFESSTVDERILILLTDGNDTASRMTPINAADIAAQRGVEIHTIGIGDEGADGEDRVDFATLAAIAERTGGAFQRADDEAALSAVYRAIDAATAAEVRTESWRPRRSLVAWPAAFALLLALLYCSVALLLQRRAASA